MTKALVGQIAESVGFEAIQQSACETLSDILVQYIAEIGAATHAYAELAGRSDCNINDLVSIAIHASPSSIEFRTCHWIDIKFKGKLSERVHL